MLARIAPPATVVAAIDFSEIAPLVVRRALDTAREMNAMQLHFIHVRLASADDAQSAQRCDEFGTWIGAQLSSPLPRSLQVLAHETSGDPAESVVALANKLQASCVVVGARSRSGAGRRVLGSVARSVIRSAECPVLVVRPEVPPSVQMPAQSQMYGG